MDGCGSAVHRGLLILRHKNIDASLMFIGDFILRPILQDLLVDFPLLCFLWNYNSVMFIGEFVALLPLYFFLLCYPLCSLLMSVTGYSTFVVNVCSGACKLPYLASFQFFSITCCWLHWIYSMWCGKVESCGIKDDHWASIASNHCFHLFSELQVRSSC